jgi:hypothetical protein
MLRVETPVIDRDVYQKPRAVGNCGVESFDTVFTDSWIVYCHHRAFELLGVGAADQKGQQQKRQ